jgi:uncharacterized protein
MKRLQILALSIVLAAIAAALVFFAHPFRPAPVAASSQELPPQPVNLVALRTRAENGEAQAQLQLGNVYAKGESVHQSYDDAAKWYEKAAAQGNAEARLALGELYEAGQGVPKDVTRALELYRQAAEQGLAAAQYTLGFMYEAGRGVAADQAQAALWYRRAAEQGDPLAQYDLGQRYDLGVGVSTNAIEAYKWLTLAAAQGQPDSAARLKKVQAKMTHAEVAEANRSVAEFSPRKPASRCASPAHLPR